MNFEKIEGKADCNSFSLPKLTYCLISFLMLYETQLSAACAALLRFFATSGFVYLKSKIPGKLLWCGFKKRNEIAFVSICKAKELSHLFTNKNSQS